MKVYDLYKRTDALLLKLANALQQHDVDRCEFFPDRPSEAEAHAALNEQIREVEQELESISPRAHEHEEWLVRANGGASYEQHGCATLWVLNHIHEYLKQHKRISVWSDNHWIWSSEKRFESLREALRVEAVKAAGLAPTSGVDVTEEQPAETQNVTVEERAMLVFANNPALNKSQIAEKIGVKKQSLVPSRCPRLAEMMALEKEAAKSSIPHGHKAEGRIEAYDDV